MVLFQISLDPTRILGADFFNFLLPFVFVFVVSYALLVKIGIFGGSADAKKRINLLIALVFALFVTAAAGPQFAAFFARFFSGATVFIIGILIFAMFLSLVTNKSIADGVLGNILTYVIVIVAIILFLSAQGQIPGVNIDNQTAAVIFAGIVLLAAIWYIVGYEEKKEAPPAEKKV